MVNSLNLQGYSIEFISIPYIVSDGSYFLRTNALNFKYFIQNVTLHSKILERKEKKWFNA